ncbi:MAG: tetratricopeptide repeat protein [Planctomycetes bacterium]|nr:tetratricopeptide repeat protein [Planctomycetota bacterium]
MITAPNNQPSRWESKYRAMSCRCRILLLASLIVLFGGIAILPAAGGANDQRADKLFETAKSAYEMERWTDACNKFYEFMAAAPYDPRNAEAQYLVGRGYMHRNYLNKAIKEFTYLVKDFPKSQYAALGFHYRSECYLKTREEDKAIADKEKVIARPVKHRWHYQKKDPFKRQLGTNHRHDVFWLAKRYIKEEQYEKAIAAYRCLPHELEAFRRVVNVHYKQGKFDKIKELIDGLEEKNKHAAFQHMIEFYAKKKAYNQLKDIFQKLLQTKKPNRKTDDLVRRTAENFRHFGMDKWEAAMLMVGQHYPRQARYADRRLCQHNWRNMNYQDRMELFVIKYKKGPWVDWVLRHKGITLERHGKAEEARNDYRRIGQTAMGHWYAAESYHDRYAKKKDYKAAVEEYEKLRKAFYSQHWSARAQWRIGHIYRKHIKDVEKGAEAFRHIAKRWPSLKTSAYHRSHRIDVRLNEARPYCYKQWKLYAAAAARLALGDTLREAGRYDDAIMEYKTLVIRYRKTESASIGAYRTALCYEGLKNPDMAIKVLKSVLRRYPKTAAASDAHTRLEERYKIPDTEVSDELDFFEEAEKDYLEKHD